MGGTVSVFNAVSGTLLGQIVPPARELTFQEPLYEYADLALPFYPQSPGLFFTYDNRNPTLPEVSFDAFFINLMAELSDPLRISASVVQAALNRDDGMIHVRDFGAVGDGVTDDTKAIQKCIDLAAANYTNGSGPVIVFVPSDMTCLIQRATAPPPTAPPWDYALIMRSGVTLHVDGKIVLGTLPGYAVGDTWAIVNQAALTPYFGGGIPGSPPLDVKLKITSSDPGQTVTVVGAGTTAPYGGGIYLASPLFQESSNLLAQGVVGYTTQNTYGALWLVKTTVGTGTVTILNATTNAPIGTIPPGQTAFQPFFDENIQFRGKGTIDGGVVKTAFGVVMQFVNYLTIQAGLTFQNWQTALCLNICSFPIILGGNFNNNSANGIETISVVGLQMTGVGPSLNGRGSSPPAGFIFQGGGYGMVLAYSSQTLLQNSDFSGNVKAGLKLTGFDVGGDTLVKHNRMNANGFNGVEVAGLAAVQNIQSAFAMNHVRILGNEMTGNGPPIGSPIFSSATIGWGVYAHATYGLEVSSNLMNQNQKGPAKLSASFAAKTLSNGGIGNGQQVDVVDDQILWNSHDNPELNAGVIYRQGFKYVYFRTITEVPAGPIDGFNVTFSLSHIPNPTTSVKLLLDGNPQVQGTDYTLQFVFPGFENIIYANPPQPGSTHTVTYQY